MEPTHPSGSDFFGTCWVVDHRNGLVVTNRHVLVAMVERLPHAVARRSTGFRVFDGAFVDFAAESGSADVRRYRVVEATPSQVNGTNFARLDAAVLRIEPLPDGPQDVPDALTVSADPDGPLGRLASYCIVGYPAQPVYESGTIEGVDWAWVTRTLFGNVYGVKRLAPGMTHRPLGSLPGDKRRWVFGHDATTLGGNSGSPALAWTDSAFGLHFAGRSIDAITWPVTIRLSSDSRWRATEVTASASIGPWASGCFARRYPTIAGSSWARRLIGVAIRDGAIALIRIPSRA